MPSFLFPVSITDSSMISAKTTARSMNIPAIPIPHRNKTITHPIKLSKNTIGKANNDDKRESLSYKLKKILEIEAKGVLCSDVYIQEQGFVSPDDIVGKADIVILATPHAAYAELDFRKENILVDVWNFYGKGGLF